MPQYAIVLTGLGGLILTWVAVFKLLLPATRVVRGGWLRFWGVVDTIAGRDEPIRDRATGRELVPAMPPLANRLDSLEDAVKTLIEVVADQHETRQMVDDHETRIGVNEGRLNEHDSAIAAILAATYDRGAESALKAEELRQSETVDGKVEES
ncbi:MAG: hypothetical protein J7518_15000 [Nocardioidaceae bacterium]|nr:hypothetical protein [Nocardioidaceae bacterium]